MRVGVIGQVDSDSFAENVSEALHDMGHLVTRLGLARPHSRSRHRTHLGILARQALPPLDERFQRRIAENAHGAGCVFRKKAGVCRFDAGVLSTMPPAEIAGVNGRLFQVTGCGAAVLTEFRPAVPELFAVGDEVLAFRDFDELVGQATRLLNETSLTARLGATAARRVDRDHTYELRVAAIMEKVS